jgi:hypothetical protein
VLSSGRAPAYMPPPFPPTEISVCALPRQSYAPYPSLGPDTFGEPRSGEFSPFRQGMPASLRPRRAGAFHERLHRRSRRPGRRRAGASRLPRARPPLSFRDPVPRLPASVARRRPASSPVRGLSLWGSCRAPCPGGPGCIPRGSGTRRRSGDFGRVAHRPRRANKLPSAACSIRPVSGLPMARSIWTNWEGDMLPKGPLRQSTS